MTYWLAFMILALLSGSACYVIRLYTLNRLAVDMGFTYSFGWLLDLDLHSLGGSLD
jgi:hypothetical protein